MASMGFSLVVAFCWIFSQCSAQDFSCTIARSQDGVTYRISDESRPKDFDASKCTVLWINSTNHTVATKKEKMTFVIETSINKLKISTCMDNIVCKQQCESKTGIWKDFKAICTMSCAENSSSRGEEQHLIHGIENGQLVWIVAGVFLILVAGLCLILYIFRRKIPRCGNYQFVRAQTAAEGPPV